jgi:hypothetical protein
MLFTADLGIWCLFVEADCYRAALTDSYSKHLLIDDDSFVREATKSGKFAENKANNFYCTGLKICSTATVFVNRRARWPQTLLVLYGRYRT